MQDVVEQGSAAPLSFSWLHGAMTGYMREGSASRAAVIERWAFGIGFSMGIIGVVVSSLPGWIPPEITLGILLVCVGVEIAGLGLWFVLIIWQLLRAGNTHADEMDHAYAGYHRLLERLARFPRTQREQHLRFAAGLNSRITDRLGLLFGSMQALGVFPVVIAVYLQFRGWEWGGWAGAFDVSLVGGFLIGMLVLLYGLGWMAINLRSRVAFYARALEDSLIAADAS